LLLLLSITNDDDFLFSIVISLGREVTEESGRYDQIIIIIIIIIKAEIKLTLAQL